MKRSSSIRQHYAIMRDDRASDPFTLDLDFEDRITALQTADVGKTLRAAQTRPHQKPCVNCGKLFRTPPSSKTRTCSKACSSRHRSRKHLGIVNTWSNTVAARTAAERTGNLHLGTPAARVSRKAGPYESNINAKEWIVVAPNGERHHARNLRLWCDTHADLFAPYTGEAAYSGLRKVSAWLRGKTERTISRWRGWSLADLPQKRTT